jgi:hypothetical protein
MPFHYYADYDIFAIISFSLIAAIFAAFIAIIFIIFDDFHFRHFILRHAIDDTPRHMISITAIIFISHY